MDDYSILSPVMETEDEKIAEPPYFKDLNLDQILESIFRLKKDYDLCGYYYRLPKRRDTVCYRQEILAELEEKDLFAVFEDFADGMRQVRESLEKKKDSKVRQQTIRWQYDALYFCINAEMRLMHALETAGTDSAGLSQLYHRLKKRTEQNDFQQCYEKMQELKEKLDSMKVYVSLRRDKMKILTTGREENYCKRFAVLFPKTYQEHLSTVESPFLYDDELSRLEQLGLDLYQSQSKELFERIAKFGEEYQMLLEDWLFVLEEEVQFYLSFHLFEKQYEVNQYHFTIPKITADPDIHIAEGYDLALLMKKLYRDETVVTNDITYIGKERFMVVTGPNQGGKTTFARSIGQILYFGLIGLKVPCRTASLPMFQGILTHFSVEESMETGKGKLLEELTRLAPMMKAEETGKFVIINELFTTAASYDAYLMGKRVMDHFISMECYGVYVTHIQELAKETEKIKSMAALVDAQDHKTRTYKIVRKPADGMGYSNGLVEKYHLTYADLTRRLGNESTAVISRK